MQNNFNNRYENKEIISKGITIGITHIDTPVVFQLKTNIQPMAVQSIGLSPLVHSVIKDTPFLSFTIQVDRDKEFLLRDIMKCVKATGGLIPIRSYDLTQFVIPVEENPGIYAGVGSKLVPFSQEDNFARVSSGTTKIQIDEFYSKFAENQIDIEEYADFFYKNYIPWYNVAYTQIYNPEGNAPILEMFIQPVDMFSYFPDGLAMFLRDDDGVVLQEALQRYVNIHQGSMLHPDLHKFFANFEKLNNGVSDKVEQKSDSNYGTQIYKLIKDEDKLFIGFPKPAKFISSNTSDVKLDLFSSNSKMTFSYQLTGYEASKNEAGDANTKILNKKEVSEIDVSGFYKEEINLKDYEIVKLNYVEPDENITNDDTKKYLIVEDGDTLQTHYINAENAPIEYSFRIYGLDALETLKRHHFSDKTKPIYDSNDTERYAMQINRIIAHSKTGTKNALDGTDIVSEINKKDTNYIKEILTPIGDYSHTKDNPRTYDKELHELKDLINTNTMFAYWFVSDIATQHAYDILLKNKSDTTNHFVDYSLETQSHGRPIITVPNIQKLNYSGVSLSSSYILKDSLKNENYSISTDTTINSIIESFSKKVISYIKYSQIKTYTSEIRNEVLTLSNILKDFLSDKNSSQSFWNMVDGYISGIKSANENISFSPEKDTLSNFNFIDSSNKKYYNAYASEQQSTIRLLEPSMPASLNKIIFSKKIEGRDEYRKYELDYSICIYNQDVSKKTDPTNKLFNSFTNANDRQIKYPKGIAAQYYSQYGLTALSTNLVYNSRDTQNINYIFSIVFNSPDSFIATDNDSKTFNLHSNPENINHIITEIQNKHTTIYPELSKPFRKLINSIDEQYMENRFIYKYTSTKTDSAYPLLHTNNGTFAEQNQVEQNDIILTYNSQNKINTDIVESLKFALNYVFYEINQNYKNILDEFDLSPNANESYKIFYDPNVGGSKYFKVSPSHSSQKYLRSYGNALSDYLTAQFVNVDNASNICVHLGAGDIVSVIKNAFQQAGGKHYNTVPSMFDKANDKALQLVGGKNSAVGSNVYIKWNNKKESEFDVPTYKDLFERMFASTKYALNLAVVFLQECKKNGLISEPSKADLYIDEINGTLDEIKNLYEEYKTQISTSKITEVQSIDGNRIDLSECEKETAEDLISVSIENIKFKELYNKLRDLILPLTLSKPLTHITKKLIMNNNNDTSITSINYIYQSNNAAITKSSVSIGSYFQHIGSTQERVIISARTSSFTLMRQLVLMYYTNDFTSKNILEMEKSRTAFNEFSTKPIYEVLSKRTRETFKQITKSDLDSVDFDYSFKIENNFLNSYGIRFGFIEDITINSVENKVGLYNINIVVVKTAPKEMVGSNVKAFNKAPYRTLITEHLLSKAIEEDFKIVKEKLPKTKYEEDLTKYLDIIGGSAGMAYLALISVSMLLHRIIKESKYQILKRYLGIVNDEQIETTILNTKTEQTRTVISKTNILDPIKKENLIDIALSLTTSLMMSNHQTFVSVFTIISNMVHEIKYPNANSEMEARTNRGIFDIAKDQLKMAIDENTYDTYNLLFKNVKMNPNGKSIGSKPFESNTSITQSYIDILQNTIHEMFQFFASGNDEYFSYMHYLSLALKFGDRYVKFEYDFPSEILNSAPVRKTSIIDTLNSSDIKTININDKKLKASDVQNTYNEIHSVLNQAIRLYKFDSKYELFGEGNEESGNKYTNPTTKKALEELTSIKNKLTIKTNNNELGKLEPFRTDKINDTPIESFGNESINVSITDTKIVFFIKYTPTFIRVLHTFQTLLRTHGYNNYNDIDELDPKTVDRDGDFFDSPITKQLTEFYLTNLFDEYYININLPEYKNDFEEDELRNAAVKKKVYGELKYIFLLTSKIIPYNVTDEFGDDRTNIISSYDLLSLKNIFHPTVKHIGFGNNIKNSDFSNNLYIYKVLSGSNALGLTFDKVIFDTDNDPNKWIGFLNNLTEKVSGDESIFHQTLMEKVPDLEKTRYFASLSQYLNVSLFGTSINIITSLTEHIYKNEITPTIFMGKEPILSYLISDDIYYWTSASLMYGTFGSNNPYASGYFSEGNYAQTMLPTVYCYPKKIIAKFLMDPKISDIQIHYILKSMLMGSKCNTSPAFYMYDQYSINTLYTYMSNQIQDIANEFQNQMGVIQPMRFEDMLREWITQQKQNILSAATSVRQLKQYIAMLLSVKNSQLQNVFAQIDAATNNILSINMYVYSELYLLEGKELTQDQKLKKSDMLAQRDNNQQLITQATSSLRDSVNTILNLYGRKEETEITKNLQSMIGHMFNDLQTARKSMQLMDEFDSIGGIGAIQNNYNTTNDFIKNISNNLSETIRDVFVNLQSSSLSNISSPVHNSNLFASMLKDNSSGTTQKKISLDIAYPIVKILFTKEDIPDMLVFDEMFMYSNVIDVIVHSEIKTSSSVATITIADPFDDLHNVIGRRLTRRRSAINPFEIQPSSAESLSSFSLETGTSIQIRMGYTRYLGEDSIVFNGKVASINTDPNGTIKTLTCYNFGSNLLTPYSPKSTNITNDDAWHVARANKNTIDEHDYTIAFGYLQDIYYVKPEAFNGLTRTEKFGSLNRSSKADMEIINRTANRQNFTTNWNFLEATYERTKFSKEKIGKLLFFGGLIRDGSTSFLENYKPSRPSTNTSMLLPSDFIYEANKSVWNMLKQMQLHYVNHYLLVRPFDNNESLVFAHMDSVYKFSSSMIGSNYNFEAMAEKFNPVNKKDIDIIKNLKQMLDFSEIFDESGFVEAEPEPSSEKSKYYESKPYPEEIEHKNSSLANIIIGKIDEIPITESTQDNQTNNLPQEPPSINQEYDSISSITQTQQEHQEYPSMKQGYDSVASITRNLQESNEVFSKAWSSASEAFNKLNESTQDINTEDGYIYHQDWLPEKYPFNEYEYDKGNMNVKEFLYIAIDSKIVIDNLTNDMETKDVIDYHTKIYSDMFDKIIGKLDTSSPTYTEDLNYLNYKKKILMDRLTSINNKTKRNVSELIYRYKKDLLKQDVLNR